MRVVKRDDEKGELSLRIDGGDDLYYLDQVLERGDLLGAQALRRVETKDDMVRSDSLPRKKVYLVISVEETEFQPFTDALRVKGQITGGPPDVKGHHTQVIEPGDNVDVTKRAHLASSLEVIAEAVKASKAPQMIAVSLDDTDASVYRIREYGIEEVETLNAGSGGKRHSGEGRWDAYMAGIVETVRPMFKEGMPILVTGPSFIKEMAAARLREALGSGARVVPLNASSGGATGLREALSGGPGLQDVIKESRVVSEAAMIEELLSRIGKGYGATYGPVQVRKALEAGAVSDLLVSDVFFRTGEGRDMVESARSSGARPTIISSHHDLGKRFLLMGGIAAFLRFDPGGS
jgi:protein pelota